MEKNELHALLALQRVPKLGNVSVKKLLQHFGSAQAVFQEKEANLLKINGFGERTLKALHNPTYREAAEHELAYIEKENLDLHFFRDKTYPEHLKHCIDAPVLLFSKGNIDLKNKKIISIVGTRKITNHGIAFCEKLIEELAPLNPVIVSGFAYGADITAHKAAIKHGLQTIGCMAHGMDTIYPKVHSKYCEQVEQNGGFFTEFWSESVFLPQNFLSRNRIIAGLSEATIVIESAEKGGSLVTADIANSYNREVFAVPGRATDKMSRGCNMLIKQQKGRLLTSTADLIYHLNWDLEKPKTHQTTLFIDLSAEEKEAVNTLKEHGKCQLDELSIQSGIPTFKLASLLLNLELKGVVRPLPGKQFELI